MNMNTHIFTQEQNMLWLSHDTDPTRTYLILDLCHRATLSSISRTTIQQSTPKLQIKSGQHESARYQSFTNNYTNQK